MVHVKKIHIKKKDKVLHLGYSLEVQESGLSAFTALARVQSLVRKLRF